MVILFSFLEVSRRCAWHMGMCTAHGQGGQGGQGEERSGPNIKIASEIY